MSAAGVVSARVVNLDEVELKHEVFGGRFESRCARIGQLVGAKDLGYSYDVVPPGKCSCPFHSHRAQEEMFFVVAGRGTLRYGDESRPIRSGDVICCPTGGPETAHQIVNDSDADLCYLSISTMIDPEICEYPDSRKIGIYDGKWRRMSHVGPDVGYWEGEV